MRVIGLQKIGKNTYVESDFLGCTVGFVVTSDGIVMIDTPFKPSEAVLWRGELSKKGEVRYIVNTDHHPDHATGNGFYSGVVVGHHGTREKFLTTENFLEEARSIDPSAAMIMKGYQARKPTITFGDSLNIYVGEQMFQLIHTPGHTENTIAVFVPKERVLFTGDTVCTEGLPSLSQSDLIGWLQSLRALKKIDADIVVPGHREVGDMRSITKFEEDLRNLIGKVRDAMERGVTREEIAKLVTYRDKIHENERYPQQYRDQPHMKESVLRSVLWIYDVVADARDRGVRIL